MPPTTTEPSSSHAAASPSRLTAADIMTPDPRTCSPFSAVTEAALIFRDEDCGVVPVVDEGKPVGILTDRDVALATVQYPDLPVHPVADIMTREVVTVPADAPPEVLKEKFADAKVHRLLVVDAGGHLAGIVAWRDLVPHLPSSEIGKVVADVLDEPTGDVNVNVKESERSGTRQEPPATPRTEDPWAWLKPRVLWEILRETGNEWMEDKVPRLGAALAYYSALSIAPLVLITLAVVGMVFGRTAGQRQIVDQLRGLIGAEGAKVIEATIASAAEPKGGIAATVVGIAVLLFGASGVFGALQDAMNTIWEVQPKPGRGLLGIIKDRFLSFGMVLGTGFLLLISMIVSAALAAVFSFARDLAPGLGVLLQLGNTLVSFAVVTVLFAMIFKLLPDVKIAWRDVWVGAVLTAALFMIGKGLIGMYLGRSGLGSAYGAAGSLVALLVWVYYSAQILFFGAEFTKVYANRYGSRIQPDADAEPLTDRARAQQGIPRAATA